MNAVRVQHWPKSRELSMNLQPRVGYVTVHRIFRSMVLAVGGALALSMPLAAQEGPPINGLTGTVALEGTVEQEYAGANTVIVKTVDGVWHVFHFGKDLLVHGGKGTGIDALQGLRAGTTVAVHYTVTGGEASAQEIDRIGDDGLVVTEGTVIGIDRGRKQITIRFDDKNTETFQLTDRAAVDAGRDLDGAPKSAVRVTVYYTDEAGDKVAHFFKKAW
jgi:hypothetical protein